MPSAASRTTLTRQWELLKLLPAKGPGLTAAQLTVQLSSAGYTTSKRTVERDLIELSRLFPLQCNDKSMPFGWYWQPGKSAELPGITLSEALTLQLLEKSLRPLIPAYMLSTLEPRFNLAHGKLEAMAAENESARWIEKVASVQPEITQLPPELDHAILEQVQQALLHERQLSCHYYSAHRDQHSELTLNPLGLVQRGQVTYLIATASPYHDIRQYVLHRFEQASLLETPSVKPEGFKLRDYIDGGAMQFGSSEKIRLRATLSEGVARLLQETPLSDDMKLSSSPNGTQLTATVGNSWELRWWILSHAESVIIHEPMDLALEIRTRLRAALDAYGPDFS